MTTENKSQFAKRINRVPSYVTELIAHGRIVLTADGKRVEVEASLEKIAATASGANPAVAARHAASRKAGTRKKRVATPIQEGTRQFYELQSQQTKNDHKQLDYELAIRKRFLMPAVRGEVNGLGNTFRSGIEKLIDLSAPRLCALTDTAQRQALLNVEIKQLCRVIKAEFPRAMRRLKSK